MKRKLYLHIGNHRTATSSIQQFMKQNFHELLAKGVFHPLGVGRHHGVMNDIFRGRRSVEEVSRTINQRADGRKANITTVTLSDEDISQRGDLKHLTEFQKYFDLRIIFSIRRQDLWLESWYFQNVKWQWNPRLAHCTFDEFLEHRKKFAWIQYDSFLTKLEGLFGKENICLTVFEKEQMARGPIAEFLRVIGIDTLDGFTDPPHANASMSAEMVEFLRHIPLHKLQHGERDIMRRAFEAVDRTYLGHTSKQSERLLERPARDALLAEYSDGNTKVARRYFDRDDLFLAPLPAKDAELAELKLPDDPARLIERFVAPMILHLVENGTISSRNRSD